MLDSLLAVTCAICWVLGFFITTQIIWKQHEVADRLDRLERQNDKP